MDMDPYASNREHPERHCKSLSMVPFSSDDRHQDFDIWIIQFEDSINRSFNPHTQKRHHQLCIKWLPGHLSPDAFVIWRRCKNQDWIQLKEELSQAFDDPLFRVEWETNLKAYIWHEQDESLRNYCSNVKRYVDKYEKGMADFPGLKAAQYYIRFFSGLPVDYQEEVQMRLPFGKRSVDRAFDICVSYFLTKKTRTTPVF